MTDAEFWQLVTLEEISNSDQAKETLTARLTPLTNEQLAAFDKHFTLKLRAAYQWSLWGAAFVMAGCNNEGDFHEFSAWLIACGKETFDAALKQPDSLANCTKVPLKDGLPSPYLDEYDLVAGFVYEARNQDELPFFPPNQTNPAGKRFKDKNKYLKQDYPQLYQKYWQAKS